MNKKSRFAMFLKNQSGKANGIVMGIVGGICGIVIIAKAAVALWPTLASTGTDVAALTQTDAGTETFQAFWPILLTLCGIGVAVAGLFFVVRKFKIGNF
ncbi:MAG: hypothetical protein PHE50_00590 [Dehalococcoidales bacterium]|nr:hypothetical protein [Dehalococcoidales bacterium]